MAESTKNTNSAVVDTSAIISQLLPDETSPKHISDIFNQFEQNTLTLFAPRLLTYEVANVLRTSVIRHRISSATSKKPLQRSYNFQSYTQISILKKHLLSQLRIHLLSMMLRT